MTGDLRRRKGDDEVAAEAQLDPMPTLVVHDMHSNDNTMPSLDHDTKASSDSFSSSDIASIALLSVLYTLQGIPMGLSGSVPLILAKRVGYAEQAIFSFCSWPFSLKLLWAPIVDSWWLPQLGRRKSWLVPVQFLTAAMMILGAGRVDEWVGDEAPASDASSFSSSASPPPQEEGAREPAGVNTRALTAYFFSLYFLMATQDIAVDGWALTMLSRGKVGYASTCNSVGQTLGYFIAFIGFLTLNDPDTCNKYLRSEPVEGAGLVSLSGFIKFWGYVFLVTTLYVWAFKPELSANAHTNNNANTHHQHNSKHPPSSSTPPLTVILSPTSIIGTASSDAAAAIAPSPSVGREKKDDDLRAKNRNLGNLESGNKNKDKARMSAVATGNGHHDNAHDEDDDDDGTVLGEGEEEEGNATVSETYSQLWMVLKLPPVRELVLILLTCKAPFAVTDAATTLKFIEYGVPKEQIAYFAPIFVVVGIVVPVVVGRFTNGPRPLSVFLAGVPLRLVSGLVLAAVLRHTKVVYGASATAAPGTKFWCFFLLASVLNNVASNLMFVAQMSFFAKISDPSIGGTYMTLLNTVANLGAKWPTSLSLAMLDKLTFKRCVQPATQPSATTWRKSRGGGNEDKSEHQNKRGGGRGLMSALLNRKKKDERASPLTTPSHRGGIFVADPSDLDWSRLSCTASEEAPPRHGQGRYHGASSSECARGGGECMTTYDGYDVQLALCTVLGAAWLALLWRKVYGLQTIPRSKWAIS